MNKTATDIINNYFGGETYVPKYLSDEGMQCASPEEEVKLAEKMELLYIQDHEPVENTDEAWEAHREVLEWIHRHNDYGCSYEVCPYCEEEVAVKAELSVQTCPNCGKRIVVCSMCRAENGEIHDRWE